MIDQQVIDSIKAVRGFSETSQQNEQGEWVIGYGSVGTHVGPNQSVTEQEADQLLIEDLQKGKQVIDTFLPGPIDQDQYNTLLERYQSEGHEKFVSDGGISIKSAPLVSSAINEASSSIGVNKDALFKIAKAESGLNPNAKNKLSSATGLFQFIDGTWKGMVKKYGKQYGIGMGDIKDPKANAIMGALFTRDHAIELKKVLGREPNVRELYLAHFSGLGGAKKVLRALKKNPNAHVSTVYSRDQINANRGLLKGTIMESFLRLTNKVK